MDKDFYPPPAYTQQQPPLQQTQPGYTTAVPQAYQGYQGGAAPPAGYPTGALPGYQAGGALPGYQAGAPPGYQPVPANTSTYVYVQGAGSCPACGVGVPNSEFTILGICLAILFFPLGIVCCLLLTERRCSHCGMTYG